MENAKDLLFTNVNIVLPDGMIENGWLLSHQGKIKLIGDQHTAKPEASANIQELDGQGGYLVAGFIDIHVHGGANEDFMQAKGEQLDRITSFHMENGTTAMLATSLTASREELTNVLEAVKQYSSKSMPYAQLVGVHLEGPFVNPKWKGAQNEDYIIVPQPDWLEEWVEQYPGLIKMQTLAPEREGAPEYISLLHKHGIVAASGHTDATFDQMQTAIQHGLSHAVHTYNAMRPLHHREPGTVGAVMLSEDVTAEIIADGLHVHPAAIKVLIKVKGTDRVVLITDAMAAAGMPDGNYLLGILPVTVKNGEAHLTDGGSLAGSTLTMIRGFRYLINEIGVSISEASKMASLNPAKVIGLQGEYGSIEADKRADLLILDKELNIQHVIIAGEIKK